MSRERGLSTVLDVAVCVLLIGGAVVTLTAVVPRAHSAASAPVGTARAVLDSTVSVRAGSGVVNGSLASLLADAAVASGTRTAPQGYVAGVERVALRRLANASRRASLTASWRPDAPCHATALSAGTEPPAGAAVDAVVLSVPIGNETRCGDAPVRLTVRTWSR
ncbi:DUF7284 family protein [Halarchaeum acidiphilum]|uniref:DUF7284 family protein n=1 Tax=Halarchaeum acidiphilum TaxID=489138 RepID=UPI0011DDC059|nr:hypothetical protein [Halarchaeum acidiphilum]